MQFSFNVTITLSSVTILSSNYLIFSTSGGSVLTPTSQVLLSPSPSFFSLSSVNTWWCTSGLLGVGVETRVGNSGRFSVGNSSPRSIRLCDCLKCLLHTLLLVFKGTFLRPIWCSHFFRRFLFFRRWKVNCMVISIRSASTARHNKYSP